MMIYTIGRKGTVRMMDGADTNNMYEKMVLIYEEYISKNNIEIGRASCRERV